MLSKTLKEVTGHTLNLTRDTSTGRDHTGIADFNGIAKLYFYVDYSSYTPVSLYITHNGEKEKITTVSGLRNFTFNDILIYNGDTIDFHTDNVSFGSSSAFSGSADYKEILDNKRIKIFNVKEIGEKINCYLFGMLPDGTRWDGN